MRNYLSLLILAASLAFTACVKKDQTPLYDPNEDTILMDVSYGTHQQQKMDIYLPAGRDQSTQWVVTIHGGGWDGGDKNDIEVTEEIINQLKSTFPNKALININYRLVDGEKNQYPAAEEDVKSAVEDVINRRFDYQIGKKHYLAGFSAGAHLAALQALKHGEENLLGCIAVAGAYNLSGAYDLAPSETQGYLKAFLGGTPDEVEENYYQASPINFISPSATKFLIFHGEEDELISVNESIKLKDKLIEQGVEVTIFTYPGGHGIPPEHLEEVMDYITDFIN